MWYKLSKIILPELGYTDVNKITPHRLDQYVKKRLKTTVVKRVGRKAIKCVPVKDDQGKTKTISKTTVHRELPDIIAILNYFIN